MLRILKLAAIAALITFLGHTASFAGEPVGTFTETLIAGSPWKVSWWSPRANGTHEMAFEMKNGEFIGKIYNASRGSTRDSALKEIAIKDGAVSFVKADNGAKYEYHVTKDGELEGTVEGLNNGRFFTVQVKAVPTKR